MKVPTMLALLAALILAPPAQAGSYRDTKNEVEAVAWPAYLSEAQGRAQAIMSPCECPEPPTAECRPGWLPVGGRLYLNGRLQRQWGDAPQGGRKRVVVNRRTCTREGGLFTCAEWLACTTCLRQE